MNRIRKSGISVLEPSPQTAHTHLQIHLQRGGMGFHLSTVESLGQKEVSSVFPARSSAEIVGQRTLPPIPCKRQRPVLLRDGETCAMISKTVGRIE